MNATMLLQASGFPDGSWRKSGILVCNLTAKRSTSSSVQQIVERLKTSALVAQVRSIAHCVSIKRSDGLSFDSALTDDLGQLVSERPLKNRTPNLHSETDTQNRPQALMSSGDTAHARPCRIHIYHCDDGKREESLDTPLTDEGEDNPVQSAPIGIAKADHPLSEPRSKASLLNGRKELPSTRRNGWLRDLGGANFTRAVAATIASLFIQTGLRYLEINFPIYADIVCQHRRIIYIVLWATLFGLFREDTSRIPRFRIDVPKMGIGGLIGALIGWLGC